MKYKSAKELFGTMPRLKHSRPGKPFDMDKSEVVNWLMAHPIVKQHMFEVARNSKAIVFDSETGEWHGSETL